MMSISAVQTVRKLPEERRAKILEAAAEIALTDGLERITPEAVAGRLDVGSELVRRHFPAVECLVVGAFQLAVAQERERMFAEQGSPMDRLAAFVRLFEGDGVAEISRLWLNARHLSRYESALAEAIEEQEELDRIRLTELIEEGCRTGDFAVTDSFSACVRIFVAVDGYGAYVNGAYPFEFSAYMHIIRDVSAWALGIDAGVLGARMAALED